MTSTNETASAKITLPWTLGLWNVYFLCKAFAYAYGLIGFHALANLAFAAALIAPLSASAMRRLRTLLAPFIGLALLYHDSYLPPPTRLLAESHQLAGFSGAYLVELLGRFVRLDVVAVIVLTLVVYLIVARWLRVTVIVMTGLVLATPFSRPVATQPSAGTGIDANAQLARPASARVDPEQNLREFFAAQARRQVDFPTPAGAPFDIIFLHVCSLSWDDLQAMGMDHHPLWQRFDILFTQFNSAATYSGPAAIRLQRATCGQSPHDALYAPARAGCYLMENLQQAGFSPAIVMNHDGHFDKFLDFLASQRGVPATPLPLAGARVAQHAFDGSPVYDDLDVLTRWQNQRAGLAGERVAMYYNSISLHDGNRLAGSAALSSSIGTYQRRLGTLLDEMNQHLDAIERSGRKAIVVLIPEHGAAIRGDRMQIAGLREIPSPAITRVPVGIAVLDPQLQRVAGSVRVDQPTSYVDVSEVIRRLFARTPWQSAQWRPADYVESLAGTPFVAQNEASLVMQVNGRTLLRQQDGEWEDYLSGEPLK